MLLRDQSENIIGVEAFMEVHAIFQGGGAQIVPNTNYQQKTSKIAQ